MILELKYLHVHHLEYMLQLFQYQINYDLISIYTLYLQNYIPSVQQLQIYQLAIHKQQIQLPTLEIFQSASSYLHPQPYDKHRTIIALFEQPLLLLYRPNAVQTKEFFALSVVLQLIDQFLLLISSVKKHLALPD